jgi:hypothetical protein
MGNKRSSGKSGPAEQALEKSIDDIFRAARAMGLEGNIPDILARKIEKPPVELLKNMQMRDMLSAIAGARMRMNKREVSNADYSRLTRTIIEAWGRLSALFGLDAPQKVESQQSIEYIVGWGDFADGAVGAHAQDSENAGAEGSNGAGN